MVEVMSAKDERVAFFEGRLEEPLVLNCAFFGVDFDLLQIDLPLEIGCVRLLLIARRFGARATATVR